MTNYSGFKKLDITTIFVTHDQIEAMGLGDRIAVMYQGKARQLGTPQEIYHEPADTFVATFLGSPPMDLLGPMVIWLVSGQKPSAVWCTSGTRKSLHLPLPSWTDGKPGSDRLLYGTIGDDLGGTTGLFPNCRQR